jgi:Carbohydrate esterase 2 N-terminal/GDSL-like Lipase/Acylhydrolase family
MKSLCCVLASAALCLGACGSGGGEVPDTTPHSYTADDPNIQYSGRIDASDPKAPKFSASGVTVTAKFKGNSIAVRLQDEFRYGRHNYYDAILDESNPTHPAPFKITPAAATTRYEVPISFDYGEHTVTLVKRTEANTGFGQFLGFDFGGVILEPPAKPAHKIEFIGDSITCGSGVEGVNNSAECMESFGEALENAYLAYGPVAARALGAEYHVTCVSGIGLVRDYSTMSGDTRPMPDVYGLTLPELQPSESPAWEPANFRSDAIVIALGTNDFSPGNPAEGVRDKMDIDAYTQAYVDFIDTLKGWYPATSFFAMGSPLLGDGYPTAADTPRTDLNTALTNVEAHYVALGDTTVHYLKITNLAGLGCTGHTNVEQQAYTAGQVKKAVQAALGW